MVFHFVKSTGDGACKCCEGCEGEYDVLCYYATTGKIKKRQYHGHGAPGIDLGERRDAQHRPNRITVTTTAVVVGGAVSLTIALRTHCGEAITVNRGTGDWWYHATAPSGYAGDPLGETYYNFPSGPNNYDGKWNFSGEAYRFTYCLSKYPINDGDTVWFSWQWWIKNQSTNGVAQEIASLRMTGSSTYEWISTASIAQIVASSPLSNEISYGGEDATIELGYTVNTPYASQDELNDAVDEVYPGYREGLGINLAFPPTTSFGNTGQAAFYMAGTAGLEGGSLDSLPWKGYCHGWSNTGFPAAFGLRSQLGSIVGLRTTTSSSAAADLPNPGPVVCFFSSLLYWTTTAESGARSMSPGRGTQTLYEWGRPGGIGTTRYLVEGVSMAFKGTNPAKAWKPIYNADGSISTTSQNAIRMYGPAEYANGKIYCFNAAAAETRVTGSPLVRSFTRVDLGTQYRYFGEHAKVAPSGPLQLMILDTADLRNLIDNPTVPQLWAPKWEVSFENPFGTCQGYPKVPYGMCVAGEYMYVLVCDDDNMWDFRWLQKYRIGVLGLELIWTKEPEFEWQAFHSLTYQSGEVWATVTASDQYTFSNPTTWIGYNIDPHD